MSLPFVADPTSLTIEDGYRLRPGGSSLYGCMRCQNRDHGACHGCSCPCSDQQFGLGDGEVYTAEQKAIIAAVGWRSWSDDPPETLVLETEQGFPVTAEMRSAGVKAALDAISELDSLLMRSDTRLSKRRLMKVADLIEKAIKAVRTLDR